MAKQIDESKVLGGKGPFYVVDEGKEGGYHGVWFKNESGLWSHLASGLTLENAHAIAAAMNERTLFAYRN